MAVLSTCEELCDNILAGVQVGEFAVVQPLSVEYSCILGYLLAWKLLLTFFKASPSHVSDCSATFTSPAATGVLVTTFHEKSMEMLTPGLCV